MKGQTIIELTDIKSGEVTRFEETNFVTNAIQNLCKPMFKSQNTINSLFFKEEGALSIDAIARGLMLFGDKFNADADAYLPTKDSNMIGHAGASTYLGTDLSMGSFNVSQSILNSDTERSYVWDFTAEQANGIINSVCLTTQVGGVVGCGSKTPPERTNTSLKPFSNIAKSRLRVLFPESIYAYTRLPVYLNLKDDCLIQIDLSKISTGTLLLYKVDLGSNKVDIFKKFPTFYGLDDSKRATNYVGHTFTDVEMISKPLPSDFAVQTTYGMAQDGKFLYITTGVSSQEYNAQSAWAPGNSMKILKINLETFEYEVLSVVNTTGVAIGIRVPYTTLTSGGCTFAVSDGYMFVRSWIQSNGMAELYAINLSDNTDVKKVTNAEGLSTIVGIDSSTNATPFLMNIQGKVIFTELTSRPHYNGSNNLGTTVCVSTRDFVAKYLGAPIASMFTNGELLQQSGLEARVFPVDDGIYYGLERRGGQTLSESDIQVHVFPNFLTTINNLSAPVEKTPSQTMRITYKLIKE